MSFSSERREPKDLPSAPPLPWGGQLRFMKALALGGLAIAALGALPFFHDIARILCATFGLTIALIGAIALAGVALSRRRARAEVEAIARGAFLARWDVPASEWNRFVEDLYERRSSVQGIATAIGGGIGLIVGLSTFAWVGIWAIPVGAVGGCALGFGFALLSAWIARRQYTFTIEPVRIWITETSIYWQRHAHAWGRFGTTLDRAAVRERDPTGAILEITTRTYSEHGSVSHTRAFPVPSGREEEARQVVRALTGEEEKSDGG
ncbi:MAG TPA: hypothetical protein VK116_09280 [Planctomycetota bacterium]|nr:hypothetical protein [Planctomycetota bacterium]